MIQNVNATQERQNFGMSLKKGEKLGDAVLARPLGEAVSISKALNKSQVALDQSKFYHLHVAPGEGGKIDIKIEHPDGQLKPLDLGTGFSGKINRFVWDRLPDEKKIAIATAMTKQLDAQHAQKA